MTRVGRSLRVAVFLAFKGLIRGNFGVTAMTILLMALIFVDVLFLPALIRGAVRTIDDQVINTVTSDLVITASAGAGTIDNPGALLAEIERTNGVRAATATTRVGTQISHGSESNAWSVDAIDPSSYRRVFTTPGHLIEGSFLRSADTTGIVLGVDVAGADRTHERTYSRSLKTVHAGDVVTVTLAGGVTRPFTVRGIYQNRFPLSDQGAFISDAAAAAILPGAPDRATAIYVKADAGVSSGALKVRLEPLRTGVNLQTPEQLTAAIQDQIDTFDLINNIMRAMSLLVAAITVFIITYVDLVNRRRQIGIERAIGITATAMVGSYVIKTVVNAIVGTLVGLAVFVFALTPFVQSHPFQFPNGPVTLVLDAQEAARNMGVLVAVAVVSVLIPAVRAMRMKILDAIWGT
ncbi:ABC transporter permease [Lacisediminihabitans profunda]|uniref:ABC transporter permease n=1 Tax=Lacisediminihabitans profunda TaxID=2594790 RepID=A0A5C8UW57_9MICO|nr:ABC transporter permease [Lacisediminihabitans profunda]